jgi:hypothetical protein
VKLQGGNGGGELAKERNYQMTIDPAILDAVIRLLEIGAGSLAVSVFLLQTVFKK